MTRGESLQDNMRDLVLRFAHAHNLKDASELTALDLHPTIRQRADYDRRMKAGIPFAEAWANSFVQDKYGAATTHWRKLQDRVARGVGNPCPLLLVGLPDSIVEF